MPAGGISWFGGPHDPSAGNNTASGAPTSTPGIAVYNRSTLGGWWMVKTPNGAIGIVRQTDIGPAPWTHRAVDFTYSLLGLFGYNEGNFPTNGQASYVWLGKDLTAISTNLGKALAQIGADPKQTAAIVSEVDAGAVKNGNPVVVGPGGQSVKTAPGGSTKLTGDATPGGLNVPNPLDAISGIVDFLTDPQTWIRFGEMLLGGLLLLMGLRSLTGQTTGPRDVARAAMKVAK